MPISVDQCKDFDGTSCAKCGRMLPDVCKAQEDIEEKARLFDELMAAKAAENKTDDQLKDEIIKDLTQEDTEVVVKKTQVPLPKRLKK